MVEMAVGGQQMNGLQLTVAEVVAQGILLRLIVGSAVDDDAFAAFVAHDVAVFLQRVALKTLDVEH